MELPQGWILIDGQISRRFSFAYFTEVVGFLGRLNKQLIVFNMAGTITYGDLRGEMYVNVLLPFNEYGVTVATILKG